MVIMPMTGKRVVLQLNATVASGLATTIRYRGHRLQTIHATI